MARRRRGSPPARFALSSLPVAGAIGLLLLSVPACGGDVRVERAGVDEVVPEAPAPQPPERGPDPCEQFHGHDDCCRAGCRFWPSDGGAICMSESHDCSVHEAICGDDEQCVEKQTTGRGGCSFHYDVDEVGRCLPNG